MEAALLVLGGRNASVGGNNRRLFIARGGTGIDRSARRRSDEGRQDRHGLFEFDPRLLGAYRGRFESWLLIVAPSTLLIALALGRKTPVIARRTFALGVVLPIRVAFRPFGALARTIIHVGCEDWTFQIGLRLPAKWRLAIALRRLLQDGLRLRRPFEWRRKAIRQGDEIVILVLLDLLAIARIAHLRLLRRLGRGDDPEIMFRMLQIIFGNDRVA
jgi:hypothetical protein